MEKIKKIDVHAHGTAFGQYTPKFRNGTTWPTAEDLIKFYDMLNIELGVLQPIISPEAINLTMTNENCKFMVDQHPERFTWFCNVDARAVKNSPDSDLGAILEHYKNMDILDLIEGRTDLSWFMYLEEGRAKVVQFLEMLFDK